MMVTKNSRKQIIHLETGVLPPLSNSPFPELISNKTDGSLDSMYDSHEATSSKLDF